MTTTPPDGNDLDSIVGRWIRRSARRGIEVASNSFVRVRTRWVRSRRKRGFLLLAGVVLVALVGGGIGYSEFRNHQEIVAAENAAVDAQAVEDAAELARQAELFGEAKDQARATLADAEVFTAEPIDYAESSEVDRLDESITRLARLLVTAVDRRSLETAIRSVTVAMTAIGERPVAHDWLVTCDSKVFPTYHAVWLASGLTICGAGQLTGDYYTPEQQAVLASGAIADLSELDVLAGVCASLNFSALGRQVVFSDDQLKQVKTALMLCPDSPAAPTLLPIIADQELEESELASGVRIPSGVHRVGAEMQPGTYVAEGKLDGCYWERTDSTGEIIDNNFIGSALRAEVTVRASDYSFTSSGCGQWRRQ
jgi:hypothetical protein